MISAAAQTPASMLPQLAPGQSLGLALGIPTVPNLRDVGGYRTRDGTQVARGLAYRSDTFNPMSPEDIRKLERIALKNDYDLRTTSEVKAKPDELPLERHAHAGGHPVHGVPPTPSGVPAGCHVARPPG